MVTQRFVSGLVPQGFVEVDAARLLLILTRFAKEINDRVRALPCFPAHPVTHHFTPEYYLQKLDFLVRYPGYFAYELVELHRLGVPSATDREEVCETVRSVLREREPDLLTQHFRRFWRGAYERIDRVEAWWYARELAYRDRERKGSAPPQKHYFLTAKAFDVVERLVAEVPHARWYSERVSVLHRFFGGLSASEVKNLQYQHELYRQAQLDELIPDLALEEIVGHFTTVFGEPLGVNLE